MPVCFPFHHGNYTRTVFKFCPGNQSQKKAPTSHLYSPQHVVNGREKKLCHTCIEFQEYIQFKFFRLKIDTM